MQRGFSLIEVILVLAVTAILAATAVLRTGDSLTLRELEDSAQQLAADIRWTQQETVNRTAGMPTPMITFYSHGYSIEAGLGNRLKPFTRFPVSVQLAGTPQPLTFTLEGRPAAGATLMLQQSGKPSRFRFVIVLQTTGRVRVVDRL
ncbi:MAG: prepilin-type N-terminal cleavage/methylation domain-containing protein [Sporomusaceae bacterium]|nr:prepilin-type N-terminal cleavage/methylation domain-containing protein [Sporomusaceae bacterium]